MQFDYSKLKGRIIELFGTRKAFADALHKSEVLVSKKLNNKSSFSQQSMDEWGKVLQIDVCDYGLYFCTPKSSND